ncbi:hypothetical protein SAMN05216241_11921 [Limimonas halophila]|uniref:Uncharacterized protein n=1 Tax=Limimonas halophila TaxID=1082479 RepID=A0A1G7V1U9_9PROT|nr:hypothetical protein [Limimonas halophila]SDG53501.1 hypothetical protein SAMN05216241_11921 [Limimonas halophila]
MTQAAPMEQPAADALAGEPFTDAEEAWFWFVRARTAQQEGARLAGGMSDTPRPCEPLDVMAVVDRLYRRRTLSHEHLRVLARYGQELARPDADVPRQRRAATLWREALDILAPALRAKGIVA